MKTIFTALFVLLTLPVSLFAGDQSLDSIFNGKDLSGWYGMKTMDPRKMDSLPDDQLEKIKADLKSETEKHWTVENGELVNDGAGPYLTTETEYSDFELKLEYKTVANADSGVYLKATPQIQIWDFTEAGGKWNIGADKGSGGLWNNKAGSPGKDPLVLADKPFGQWNSMRVLQIGARTTVYLNDKLVVDHALMDNYWNKDAPLARKGPIQLQTHGGEIRWRNIQARKIDSQEANQILASKGSDGFKSIFNGSCGTMIR